MKVAVVGTGYVGLVTGTCLAELGHCVVCVDIDAKKIQKLKKGIIPIYEPGLEELIARNFKEKRLEFTTNIRDAIERSEIVFSAVGTPAGENHEADLKYVKQVACDFGKYLNGFKIFVNKSTVPVGTSEQIVEEIEKSLAERKKKTRELKLVHEKTMRKSTEKTQEFDVVSNPEFLREGSAVKDFIVPDRIIIGLCKGTTEKEKLKTEQTKKIIRKLYEPLVRVGSPIVITDIRSSEIIKYASNAFLATKISFMNEIANFCDLIGGDVKEIAKGIGLDKRIGPKFLHAGIGYGGSCFPKDVRAFIQTGKTRNYKFRILAMVDEVNNHQKRLMFEKIKKVLGTLKGKVVAVWGLSFKPKTDDIREAPSIFVIGKLLAEGAKIQVFDPVAEENAKKSIGAMNFIDIKKSIGVKNFMNAKNFDSTKKSIEKGSIFYSKNAYEACQGADVLAIMTEWDEFRILDFEKLKNTMKGRIIIDGRNMYEREDVEKEGFKYICFGR
ncbi:UDP-glucose/GDP-mannose dehydrogenase family protein [Candidatus Peregrinibacteria bacterium]|nr:UDP-glucose/GDP-mannose dehydrogenase family protein [Candidatus Peregrinibacteria bacterium]